MAYRVAILEQHEGTWVLAPLDIEKVGKLDEARKLARLAPINIYGPGQVIGRDEPLEQITDQYT